MSLTVKELTELAKNYKPTEQEVIDFWKRYADAQERFKVEELARRPTEEWLNRTYNI